VNAVAIEVKVTQVGSSLGVVLPKYVLERLKVGKGDHLHVIETPTGIVLTPLDPAVQEQIRAMDEVFVDYRETLEALAK
jgi:putative addiction module antidote